MKLPSILALAIGLFFLADASSAQDEETQSSLIRAIEKLAAEDRLVFAGSVKQEKPKESGPFGVGGIQVFSMIGAQAGKPFEGDVEIMTTKDGEVVLVSKKELPGLSLYTDGINVIRRKTIQNDDFSTKKIATNLPQLTDWSRLIKSIKKGSKVRKVERDGQTQMICLLDEGYLKEEEKNDGPIKIRSNLAKEEVLETTATFTIDDQGAISGVTFAIQYSDPIKKMMKNGTIRFGVGPGGLAEKKEEEKDDEDEGPALGDRSVITLEITDKPLTKAEAFRKFASSSIEN